MAIYNIKNELRMNESGANSVNCFKFDIIIMYNLNNKFAHNIKLVIY